MFRADWEKQRELDRKRKAFAHLTSKNLDYTALEDLVSASARQRPGFYSVLKFPDGTTLELGKKDLPIRQDGGTF